MGQYPSFREHDDFCSIYSTLKIKYYFCGYNWTCDSMRVNISLKKASIVIVFVRHIYKYEQINILI